jgi:crotonobetainyl-CoA:carnitine CoA-transferase CaiB-like acyl-CoA transferase
MNATVAAPLTGIRVLDFTRQMSGPYAALMLSDYGANVIKVESIPTGDGSRTTGTDFIDGESALFLMWNRGKRSIALDLRTSEGLDVALRLAAQADVVLENYRPGVADRIGIGYGALSRQNERLVYCSISAFGETGPLADAPGTDPVVQAMSGVMSVTGERGGGPALVGVPVADFTAAMLGFQGVLLALLAREHTGRGQKVGISMLDGLLSALTTRLATHWNTGVDPVACGSAHSVVVPYQAFATKDGHVVAGVWGNEGWPRFCKAIDRPDLENDPRYASNVGRIRLRDELEPVLDAIFATRTSAEWETRFREHGALFGPVYRFSEILSHPQVTGRGLVQQVEHPTLGQINQLGPVIELHDTPGGIAGPPPLLGQHTEEVLREAGLSSEEAAALIDRGVAAIPAGARG